LGGPLKIDLEVSFVMTTNYDESAWRKQQLLLTAGHD